MSTKPKTRGLAEILRLEKERRERETQQTSEAFTSAPGATVAPDATVEPGDPYKRKALKENNKKESAPPDYKNCPDCQGSGFWYLEGAEKGVAKCKHKRLTKKND
jgi:hypothetical protein